MIEFQLGGFGLSFEETGKLFQLSLPGSGPVLHESSYDFDLKDGRVFHPGGWDECFPTIEPYSGWPVMGRLIGVTPEFSHRGDEARQVWRVPEFTAERLFSLQSEHRLQIAFRVVNHSAVSLKFLWASHALFSLQDLVEVRFPDGTSLDDFSLDGSAPKSFVKADGPVRFIRRAGSFSLHTDQPWWGVWFNRGGWPADDPAGFGCLGIEATNTEADQPEGTCLAPGESFSGNVWLER